MIEEHIKKARVKAGFTQKDVESKLGMRNLMIRDYEMGRLKLPVKIALELAELYGVSLDELLGYGNQSLLGAEEKVLDNFKTLFKGNGFGLMFLDPVIRGFVEEHKEDFFSHSIFELLVLGLNQKKVDEIILEIGRFLFSLAGSDDKISLSEKRCVHYLLDSFELESKLKLVSQSIAEEYLPEKLPGSFTRVELKHFVIWILFFFSSADGEVTYQEVEYIEKLAEVLRMNKSNFLSIKNNFVKENI